MDPHPNQAFLGGMVNLALILESFLGPVDLNRVRHMKKSWQE